MLLFLTWTLIFDIFQAFNNDSLPVLPDATPKAWSKVTDGCYLTPYAVNGPYWIGYDDETSLTLKDCS